MKEEFEENINLLSFYYIIDSLYKNDDNNYPEDLKKKMKSLLNELEKYVHHKKTGYKIADEKFVTKMTYYINEPKETKNNKGFISSLFRK